MGNILRIVLKGIGAFFTILKDYCLNSSLSGVAYIADKRYHITERLFWLTCVIASAFGSYYLIKEYRDSFEKNAISIVVEDFRPFETVNFPSLGICELGYTKGRYPELEKFVQSLHNDYNFEVEEFLFRMVFQNLYSFRSLYPYCAPHEHCTTECAKCPESGYREIAKAVRANCSELLAKCTWKGKDFDCCKYFQPLETTMGNCFLLNSIQVIKSNDRRWLNMEIGWDDGVPVLEIDARKPIAINILNEEDIPHIMLKSLYFDGQNVGFRTSIKLNLQNMINDASVKNIQPIYRKCLFPDEVPKNFTHKYYSYSTCVTHCLKEAQLKECNCTNYNMIINDNDRSPICDFKGFLCLDEMNLLYPETTIMQPWSNGLMKCECSPSCTEHEIKIIEHSFKYEPKVYKTLHVEISLVSVPSQKYRRQAVRDNIDIVVSIGGILGLFMGASIMSAIELLYFFTARITGNIYKNTVKNNVEETQ